MKNWGWMEWCGWLFNNYAKSLKRLETTRGIGSSFFFLLAVLADKTIIPRFIMLAMEMRFGLLNKKKMEKKKRDELR